LYVPVNIHRRHLFLALLPAALCLAAAGLARQSSPPLPELSSLTDGERFYFLGPAEQVAGPGVGWVEAAPKGRFLLCERRKLPSFLDVPGEAPTPAEVSLVLWDARARKATTPWRVAETSERRVTLTPQGWLSPSTALILEEDGGKGTYAQSLLQVSVGGLVNRVPLVASQILPDVLIHPTLPLAVVAQTDALDTGELTLTLVRPGGSAATFPLTRKRLIPEGWDRSGTRFYLAYFVRGGEGKARLAWLACDLAGKLTELPEKPADLVQKVSPDPMALPLKLAETPSKLTTGERSEPLSSLWLTSEKSEASLRVAAEIDTGSQKLLPDLSGVVYAHQRALYVAPLIALDRVAYDELLRRTQRAKLLSDGKNVGLALMMYVQDYDETLPEPGDLTERVNPYLKNADLLSRFKFTYTGPTSIGKIESPATTVLGHLDGPGGSAVVYADGHVTWQDR
jgi:prepilin-type processing-associated H-X9-DG protein